MIKSVIIVGGPQKGTRFRPLSLDTPKPLFPVAGFPIIYHHIEACSRVPNLKEILLIGFYQQNEDLQNFIINSQTEFKIQIRYLQEYTSLGTAGGIYHFRDQILAGNPEYFFVMNGDVCSDFPLMDMLDFHRLKGNGTHATIMGTEATRQQALTYGCIVEDKNTHEVLHYVEKPETFISTTINCGVYLFSPQIVNVLSAAFQKNQEENYSNDGEVTLSLEISVPPREIIHFEKDIFIPMAGSGTLYVFQTQKFWSQIKSASAVIYANRHYLNIYKRTHPQLLAVAAPGKPQIRGDVFIHPTASVDPSAVLGPNVTIGKNATVGAGARIRESIVLEGATLQDHCCVLYSIVGWKSSVGAWSRVEGTPNDPNPNKPFAKLEMTELFTDNGKLNPSITVIGSNVKVPPEVIVLNSIVLPDKGLSHSYKNQIIL